MVIASRSPGGSGIAALPHRPPSRRVLTIHGGAGVWVTGCAGGTTRSNGGGVWERGGPLLLHRRPGAQGGCARRRRAGALDGLDAGLDGFALGSSFFYYFINRSGHLTAAAVNLHFL